MWPRYAQWAHAEYILNVPSHLTPMYPVAKHSGTFSMFGEIQSQCAQWVKCWIYSKYALLKKFNVTKGQVLIGFTMYLVMWLSCIQIKGLGTSGTMCWMSSRYFSHSFFARFLNLVTYTLVHLFHYSLVIPAFHLAFTLSTCYSTNDSHELLWLHDYTLHFILILPSHSFNRWNEDLIDFFETSDGYTLTTDF